MICKFDVNKILASSPLNIWVKGVFLYKISDYFTQAASAEQKEYKKKVLVMRSCKPEITQEMKDAMAAHKKKFEKSREPLINGIASQYDMDLFREAQAKACEQLVSAGANSICASTRMSFEVCRAN